MLAHYFGFREDPFGVTPDCRFLFESATHSEALASLKYAFLSARGFVALVAPPGMGKTTLLMRFLEEIRQSARSVFLFDIDPNCSPNDVIAYILRDLGITPGSNSAEMHEQLKAEVAYEARAGRQFVVVIDEAQNLSDTSLEVVRTLTNFETPRSKLILVVLSGQPQLAAKLKRPALEQLRQRIAMFCGIEPLSLEQSVAYVDHRIKFAGYSGPPLFSGEAIDRIAKASQGIPRVLNNLCWNALSLCRAMKCKQVDAAMVAEVLADLQFVQAQVAGAAALRAPAAPRPAAPVPPASVTPTWLESTRAALHRHSMAASAALLAFALMLLLWGWSVRRDAARLQAVESAQRAEPVLAAVRSPLEANRPSPLNSPAIAVVVKRNQSIRELSLQYLGEFNKKRVLQIMKLNPEMKNPNLILEGQTILLPRPTGVGEPGAGVN